MQPVLRIRAGFLGRCPFCFGGIRQAVWTSCSAFKCEYVYNIGLMWTL
ncbi:hypothetical protein NEIPOLOT_01775 [Neisseria polysaccharea ATCC 43768]|nr:hypothetical protein NEIPOLOT_01775 [Neisseria polysaccharea ATCC 43768]